MPKKFLLTCFVVVWAFIPPAKSEMTINIYERDASLEALPLLSADDINEIPEKIEEMFQVSAEMDAYITRMEKQIALMKQDIVNVQNTIDNGLHVSAQELEKFASKRVDVAEKEISKGIVYDIDIYDHAKKLATPTWSEFKEKYNI